MATLQMWVIKSRPGGRHAVSYRLSEPIHKRAGIVQVTEHIAYRTEEGEDLLRKMVAGLMTPGSRVEEVSSTDPYWLNVFHADTVDWWHVHSFMEALLTKQGIAFEVVSSPSDPLVKRIFTILKFRHHPRHKRSAT